MMSADPLHANLPRAKPTPLRVLQVMASGARGGGADHLRGLCPALRTLGHDVHVCVDSDGPLGERLRSDGFMVHDAPLMRSRWDLRLSRCIHEVIHRVQPDVIHYHGTRAAFYGSFVRRVGGPVLAPSIYTVHGLSYRKTFATTMEGRVQRQLFIWVEQQICRHMDAVISVAKVDLDDLLSRGALPAQQGYAIGNAIDTHRFAPAPDPHSPSRAQLRDALRLPSDTFLFGTVSRLVPQKGVADLLTAWARFKQQRQAPAQLIVVGDGTLSAALQAQAQSLGISGSVHWLGSRDDIPNLLQDLDAFVLSSRWEGEPIALLEAMATALPCVATATSGAQELLQNGTLGHLVPVADPAALAAGLQFLYSEDALRAKLGERARQAVMARSYLAVAKQVGEVYQVVQRHRAAA